jgi:beta-glucosidase
MKLRIQIKPMLIHKTIPLLCLSLLFAAANLNAQSDKTILSDVDLDKVNREVSALVSQMTLDEKMSFMTGHRDEFDYNGPPSIPRLNIPSYIIAHGPYGTRAFKYVEDKTTPIIVYGTFMPVSMNYASSWDPGLVYRVGSGVGKEIRSLNNHAVAGPAFNIVRDLRCGRSAEYFTEDPYLNAGTSVPFVKGLQDQDVIVHLKHMVCNNQEFSRGSIDVRVSKRVLHEIYFPGFEYAVTEAGAMGIMSSYNKINGKWAAENPYVLTDVLRNRWGFQGFVLSDWGGTHSTVETIEAGLDLEMPRPKWYGEKLKKAVLDGEVSEELVNERISNILRTMFVAKLFDDDYRNPSSEEVFKSREMKELAHELALNSMVLLKNENNVLPFKKSEINKIAVIGPHADYGVHFNEGDFDITLFQVGGSSRVIPEPEDMITPLKGMKNYLGEGTEILYSPGVYAENGCGPIEPEYLLSKEGRQGLSATYYGGKDFAEAERSAVDPTVSFQWREDPLEPEAGLRMESGDRFSARWEGKLQAPESRTYLFELRCEGEAKLFIDDKMVFEGEGTNNYWWHQVEVPLAEGEHDIKLEYSKTGSKGIMKLWWDFENVAWMKEAVDMAKNADAVVLNVGNSGNIEREGRDRFQGLQLSKAQQNLIREISKVNKNIAVVTFTSGITMQNWVDDVPAIISAFYPGEQAGNALAKLLFGDANPNGKLPVTWPTSIDQYPEGHWAGHAESIEYKEGVFVGYRWFDKHDLEPRFPFGHGLSYTTFQYGKPSVAVEDDGIPVVSIEVINSGPVEGAEVVQLYVKDMKSSVERPLKELKGYKKINLQAGEKAMVNFHLNDRSFSFFDETLDDWVIEPGEFEILLGSSSKDIRQSVKYVHK